MDKKYLRVHNILYNSSSNGPGLRTVIWTQGCSIRCKGCFNKKTHNQGGELIQVSDLVQSILKIKNDGITISGGEPLDQCEELLTFITKYRKHSKGTILLFTGYSLNEIIRDSKKVSVIKNCDAVLAGRYEEGDVWSNKELLIVTGEIKSEDLSPDEIIEISFNNEKITITGYPKI